MHRHADGRARCADGLACSEEFGIGPLPRLHGHVEVAGAVGNAGEHRQVRRAEQTALVRAREELEGLLPPSARGGVVSTLQSSKGAQVVHRLIALIRTPSRPSYRGNSVAHASLVGATNAVATIPTQGEAMETAAVNGVELEYEVTGSGEPVLLVSPVLADGFLPLVAEPSLHDRYQLIRYHKRGWVGSTHSQTPVSVGDHAKDAAALARTPRSSPRPRRRAFQRSSRRGPAGPRRTRPRGHPDPAGTLALLGAQRRGVPRERRPRVRCIRAGPARRGRRDVPERGERARLGDLSSASSTSAFPGAVEQAVKDADTFFGVELPGLTQWTLEPEQAAAIDQPVLSMLGSDTQILWVEVAEFLRSSLPNVEERTINGVGHLLHVQQPEPVAARDR